MSSCILKKDNLIAAQLIRFIDGIKLFIEDDVKIIRPIVITCLLEFQKQMKDNEETINISCDRLSTKCYALYISTNGYISYNNIYDDICNNDNKETDSLILEYPTIVVRYYPSNLNIKNDRRGYLAIFIPSLDSKNNESQVENMKYINLLYLKQRKSLNISNTKLLVDGENNDKMKGKHRHTDFLKVI